MTGVTDEFIYHPAAEVLLKCLIQEHGFHAIPIQTVQPLSILTMSLLSLSPLPSSILPSLHPLFPSLPPLPLPSCFLAIIVSLFFQQIWVCVVLETSKLIIYLVS